MITIVELLKLFGSMIAAYILFRMVEVISFSSNRYHSKTAHWLRRLSAVGVIAVTLSFIRSALDLLKTTRDFVQSIQSIIDAYKSWATS